MTQSDTLLDRLWASDAPPARDPAFVIAVMERTARASAAREWLNLGLATLAGGALAWAGAPILSDVASRATGGLDSPQLVMASVIVASLAGLYALAGGARELGFGLRD